MRRVAYVFGALAAAGAGTYLIVYLYRWQWQRAMLCGVLLLVVEVMLFGVVMLGRLTRIEERLRDTDRRQRESDARQADVLDRLRQPAAEREDVRFRWLRDPADRTYVFVPVLMVTGVLLSALAWVVQRIASVTARPAERRLAGRLAVLAAPDASSLTDPYAPHSDRHAQGTHRPPQRLTPRWFRHGSKAPAARQDPEAPEARDDLNNLSDLKNPYNPNPYSLDDLDDLPPLGARPSPARAARLVAAVAVVAALLTALVAGLAELTQTRQERANGNAATSVIVRVDMRGADMTAERRSLAAQQVWERCRDSTSVPLRHATLGDLGDGLYAGVVRPALTENDRMRLRGCLEDATLERAALTVVGIGDATQDGH
ncbi:hypothetical protein [Streptomyces sp. A012304]|uniref:hypothetical protein n=1 Tax=Streptomyces sp. A012304 TaxID=375446 RepID=UPI0022308F2F|nr:hypothetical protein [Streptomyces sp. A012304]GKQ38195.1 hypothetical protein ALMP_47280 [Streptomyces sp. A012304]